MDGKKFRKMGKDRDFNMLHNKFSKSAGQRGAHGGTMALTEELVVEGEVVVV